MCLTRENARVYTASDLICLIAFAYRMVLTVSCKNVSSVRMIHDASESVTGYSDSEGDIAAIMMVLHLPFNALLTQGTE